jgi:uncharacterized membrane-anchored protein
VSEHIFATDDQRFAWQGPSWLERGLAWTRTHHTPLLVAAVGLQLLVLVAMIGMLSTPLLVGRTVLLQVVPVDPRDLFRGDYVTLSYEISRVPVEGIAAQLAAQRPPRDRYGRTGAEYPVYVTLEPEADGRHYRAGKASMQRPAAGTYIKGQYGDDWRPGGSLRFGIESFYVPEGTGRKYEEAQRDRRLWAEVAVTPWGQATLRGLHIDIDVPRPGPRP